MRGDVVSEMIYELNEIQILGGFNHNQIMNILKGFQDETIHDIGEEREGVVVVVVVVVVAVVEEGGYKLGFYLRMFQVYAWFIPMNLLP